jgi:hypothetical protein
MPVIVPVVVIMVMTVIVPVVVIMVMTVIVPVVVVKAMPMVVPVVMVMVMPVIVPVVVVMVMTVIVPVVVIMVMPVIVPVVVVMVMPVIVPVVVVMVMPMVVPVVVVMVMTVIVPVVVVKAMAGAGGIFSDHGPKHVRLIGQLHRSRPVTDRFHHHRRELRRKFLHNPGYNAGAGRRSQFGPVRCGGDRQSFHHFQCGRRRHRVQAVGAPDHPGSKRNGGSNDFVDLQRINGQGNSDDIDNRVDGSHFVKVDGFHCCSVYLGFGSRNPCENRQAEGCRPFAETRAMDHRCNFGVMAVMLRRVGRIRNDVQFQSGNPPFDHPPPFQRIRFDRQFGQFAFNVRLIRTGIYQRGKRHISADAGETIQKQ